ARLAVNSNFLVFFISSDDKMGQSFASLVPTVAAAESAIRLAIFVITFRVRGTIAVESINSIQVGRVRAFLAGRATTTKEIDPSIEPYLFTRERARKPAKTLPRGSLLSPTPLLMDKDVRKESS
ncbi:NADH dehydrogenase subunit 4L, partial [Tanacetum coccineum]